ncbi:uncharacterized protein LOC135471865 [Liolophura sinensis]|uniref:uncharacterized protein LOC135471865 n=1 Tax=Liolophura sinensis TaxID=3198878 RepID=UPI00315959E4
MSQEFTNLEEIVRKWAMDFPLDAKVRNNADDILSGDINWNNLRVSHGETEYFDQIRSTSPKSHVLFTAHFTNSTEKDQVYTLKTERRTRSTCTVAVMKGFTYGYNMDIKLTPPNPVIEANAGFHGEMAIEKTSDNTFEEELVWSVDNQITVPPMFKTTAKLVIKEDEYNGHFKTESKFAGKVHVTLRSKKDNTILTTITGTAKQIFTADKGFRVDKTGVHHVTTGVCRCKFGIEQHVKLSQSKIEDGEEQE